jgi:acyl-CoA thioesterase-2
MSDSVAPIDHLVHVLGLGTPSAHDGHTFVTGESLYFPTGRVYGGQVIAQSLMAGALTAPDTRLPHSIHGYFIAPGDIHQDVLFDTEKLRDGRSFSARRINATQSNGAILTAIASYQEDGQVGVDFHDPAPQNVPDPETLTSAQELMEPYAEQSEFANYYASKSPFDIRHVTRTVMLGSDKESAAADSGHQLVWMRANIPSDAHTTPGNISRLLNRALLAVGCDQIMMEPVLRRSGLSFMTPGISFATIDHSMWWYGDIDITRWHLYVQDSPVAGHGRGLCQARVYQDGELVAAMTQEAMIRVPKK